MYVRAFRNIAGLRKPVYSEDNNTILSEQRLNKIDFFFQDLLCIELIYNV